MKKWRYNKKTTFENLHTTKSQWSDTLPSSAGKTRSTTPRSSLQKPIKNVLPNSMGLFPLTSAVYLRHDESHIFRPRAKKKSATYPVARRARRIFYEPEDSIGHIRPSSAMVPSKPTLTQNDSALASLVKSSISHTDDTTNNKSSDETPELLMPTTDSEDKTSLFNETEHNNLTRTQTMIDLDSSSLPSAFQKFDEDSRPKSDDEQEPELTEEDLKFLPCAQDSPDLGA